MSGWRYSYFIFFVLRCGYILFFVPKNPYIMMQPKEQGPNHVLLFFFFFKTGAIIFFVYYTSHINLVENFGMRFFLVTPSPMRLTAETMMLTHPTILGGVSSTNLLIFILRTVAIVPRTRCTSWNDRRYFCIAYNISLCCNKIISLSYNLIV